MKLTWGSENKNYGLEIENKDYTVYWWEFNLLRTYNTSRESYKNRCKYLLAAN